MNDAGQMKVDVVIPTTGEPTLNFCLQAIRKFMHINRIILVGPGNLQSKFKDWKDVVFVASNTKNIGKIRALGLRYVKTKYYASIDSDVIINKDWYNWCTQTIVRDKVAACQGFAKDTSERSTRILRNTFEDNSFITLGNTMLKTDVTRKVGMPEKKYAEDIDLMHRIKTIGYEWIFNENIVCQHLMTDVEYWIHLAKWGEIGGNEALKPCQWLRTIGGAFSKCLLRNNLCDCLFYSIGKFFLLYGYLKGVIKKKLLR